MAADISTMKVPEALSVAILAETEAAAIYNTLKSKVKNFVIRDKLDFLIGEEEKHRKILEALFDKICPSETIDPNLSIPATLKINVGDDDSVLDILRAAMDAEQIFHKFYADLAARVTEKGTQEILQYLSSMEHGHYIILEGEFKLCQNDEQYYERGEFEYDMVHIGP